MALRSPLTSDDVSSASFSICIAVFKELSGDNVSFSWRGLEAGSCTESCKGVYFVLS